MNIEGFKKNIKEQVREALIKLGYSRESMRFYYPLSSLNAILGSKEETLEDLKGLLEKAFQAEDKELGILGFALSKERMEVTVSKEGVEYVYRSAKEPSFLEDFIDLFRKDCHADIENIKALFAEYDKDYICKKMPKGEDFDYVCYFSDPQLDTYYYCIKEEMGHTIYHRFSKEDYRLLGISEEAYGI